MARHTVAEAAALVGVTRSTLFRHVREGKVSASLSLDGVKVIDTAELIRVYGALHPAPEGHSAPCDKPTQAATHKDSAVTLAVLGAKLAAAEAQIADMRERENRLLGLIAAQSARLIEKVERQGGEKPKRTWLNFWL